MISLELAQSYAEARANVARTPMNSPARAAAYEVADLKLARLKTHLLDVETVLRHVDPAALTEEARAAFRRIGGAA